MYIEKEHFNVTLEGEPNPRFPSTENKILFLFFLLDLICRSENRDPAQFIHFTRKAILGLVYNSKILFKLLRITKGLKI